MKNLTHNLILWNVLDNPELQMNILCKFLRIFFLNDID